MMENFHCLICDLMESNPQEKQLGSIVKCPTYLSASYSQAKVCFGCFSLSLAVGIELYYQISFAL